MILFLKGCGSLFWESPSSKKIFNGLQHSFQVWQGFINVSESFSYKNSLFILATTRKENFEINSTFISGFLVYLGLLNGDFCILRFLKKQNLAYQKINWLRSVILLHSNSVGVLGQVFIVSHSYQTFFGFPGLDLNIDCELHDHVITRFTSVGIRARLRNEVIFVYYFHFFSVPLSFLMFGLFIFLFFVSALYKKKKRGVIFHLVIVSNHISSIY
jgi:hypothetical protein